MHDIAWIQGWALDQELVGQDSENDVKVEQH